MAIKGRLGSGKTVKEISTKSEVSLAKKLGGNRVTGSGCLDQSKGDVSTKDYLIELKETSSKAILLDKAVLVKICKEAREVGKCPALAIKFDKTPLGVPNEWIMVPVSKFEEIK